MTHAMKQMMQRMMKMVVAVIVQMICMVRYYSLVHVSLQLVSVAKSAVQVVGRMPLIVVGSVEMVVSSDQFPPSVHLLVQAT